MRREHLKSPPSMEELKLIWESRGYSPFSAMLIVVILASVAYLYRTMKSSEKLKPSECNNEAKNGKNPEQNGRRNDGYSRLQNEIPEDFRVAMGGHTVQNVSPSISLNFDNMRIADYAHKPEREQSVDVSVSFGWMNGQVPFGLARSEQTCYINAGLQLLMADSLFYDQMQRFVSDETIDKKQTSIDDQKQTSIDDQKQTSIDDQKQTSIDDQKQTSIDDQEQTSIDDQEQTSIDDQEQTSIDDPMQSNSSPTPASTAFVKFVKRCVEARPTDDFGLPKVFIPEEVINYIHGALKQFVLGKQADCSEFVTTFLAKIGEEGPPEINPVKNLFEGAYLINEYTPERHWELGSVRMEPFTCVTINLKPDHFIIENCFDYLTAKEDVEGVLIKQLLFAKLPQLLLVQLQPFNRTRDGLFVKMCDQLLADEQLIFRRDWIASNSTAYSEPLPKYTLRAVVYHSGASYMSGHYTAGVKRPDREGRFKWFYCDDRNVQEYTLPAIKDAQPDNTLYLLLYKREDTGLIDTGAIEELHDTTEENLGNDNSLNATEDCLELDKNDSSFFQSEDEGI